VAEAGVAHRHRRHRGRDPRARPALGFVDVKVCAVTEVWSALKLVVRSELRASDGKRRPYR